MPAGPPKKPSTPGLIIELKEESKAKLWGWFFWFQRKASALESSPDALRPSCIPMLERGNEKTGNQYSVFY
jgi:hypothetical protein